MTGAGTVLCPVAVFYFQYSSFMNVYIQHKCSLINSIKSACHVSDTLLSNGNTAVDKTNKLKDLSCYWKGDDKSLNKLTAHSDKHCEGNSSWMQESTRDRLL